MDKPIDKWREIISTFIQIRQVFSQQHECSFEKKLTTMLQFEALNYIGTTEGNTMNGLAGYLKTSLSSTTQLIKRLTKLGLVKRTNDPSDRRIIRLSVTPKGIKEQERVKKFIETKMMKLFSTLPEKDLTDLIRIQKKIVENLSPEIQ